MTSSSKRKQERVKPTKRTGWPPGMFQDDSSQVSHWLSTRLGALYLYKQQRIKDETY